MIAYLRGQLLEKGVDSVVVDVHGVGYRAQVSQQTLRALPEQGQSVQLRIHTHVREDALLLLGFATAEEEHLFHLLTTVSGVGPKLGLNILSGMPASELAQALSTGEMARLTKLPGVGKRTAERLIVELKDKLKTSGLLAGHTPSLSPSTPSSGDDLLSALLNLGYRPADAERAAAQARKQSPGVTDVSELVRVALQVLLAKTG